MRFFKRLSISAALLLWLGGGIVLAETPATISVHEAGPLKVPRTPENCVLIIYPLPPGFVGAASPDTIRSLLGNNGISLKNVAFAIYDKKTGALLLAAPQFEHDVFTAGMHGD